MSRAWRTLLAWHRPLAGLTLAMLALALVSAAGWIFDERTLGGARIWAKPLKFSLSFAIYALTLAWLISLLPRHRRLAWCSGTFLAAATVLEMAAIVTQVVRGRRSHFNVDTALDSAIFSAMGMLVAVIYLATVVVAVLLSVTKLDDKVTSLAVRLGAAISIAGMSVGFLMLAATPAQMPGAATAAGAEATPPGAHSVGVADGGPGLPLLGWSTTGGDLRVGHFLGMHGLQVLALLALLLATPAGLRVSEVNRMRIVALAGIGYGALVALSVWQALRGQSLIAPDALTLTVFTALVLVTVLGAVTIARAHRATNRTPAAVGLN